MLFHRRFLLLSCSVSFEYVFMFTLFLHYLPSYQSKVLHAGLSFESAKGLGILDGSLFSLLLYSWSPVSFLSGDCFILWASANIVVAIRYCGWQLSGTARRKLSSRHFACVCVVWTQVLFAYFNEGSAYSRVRWRVLNIVSFELTFLMPFLKDLTIWYYCIHFLWSLL